MRGVRNPPGSRRFSQTTRAATREATQCARLPAASMAWIGSHIATARGRISPDQKEKLGLLVSKYLNE